MKPSLTDIEELARGAGEILQAGYGNRLQIDYKGVIDLVTDVDHRSEDYLIKSIRQKFPSHRIVTEESGEISGDADKAWFIDPLDGTVNYAHGVPLFAVSIGYADAGEMVLGAIYDPLRDEYYYAEKGGGAWLNGQPLRVSAETELNRSLLVTGFPYDIRTNPENNLDHYVNLTLKSQGVRRLGCAALDLAYIAAGHFDGFWEVAIFPWDIAAGSLIVVEAGGKVTNVHGGPDFMKHPQSILTTNGHIHDQMLAALHP
jgi:myo-inositol-1(or 4)-monophosphatase